MELKKAATADKPLDMQFGRDGGWLVGVPKWRTR
jgi:hypothetical protein